MIRINLLPHREIRRKQQQKTFYVMLGGVVGLGVAIWFAVHFYLDRQLVDQQARNSYLGSEIAALDKQIEEIKKLKEQTAALLQRKKVVESLQANRAETVLLLDQLVRQMPDGVYLKRISQKGDTVTINGLAQSNARVSTFMRNLESSAYLEKPGLIEIKAVVTDKNARLSEFNLVVSLTRKKEEPTNKKPAAKRAAAKSSTIPSGQILAPLTSTGSAAGSTINSGGLARITANRSGDSRSELALRAGQFDATSSSAAERGIGRREPS